MLDGPGVTSQFCVTPADGIEQAGLYRAITNPIRKLERGAEKLEPSAVLADRNARDREKPLAKEGFSGHSVIGSDLGRFLRVLDRATKFSAPFSALTDVLE